MCRCLSAFVYSGTHARRLTVTASSAAVCARSVTHNQPAAYCAANSQRDGNLLAFRFGHECLDDRCMTGLNSSSTCEPLTSSILSDSSHTLVPTRQGYYHPGWPLRFAYTCVYARLLCPCMPHELHLLAFRFASLA